MFPGMEQADVVREGVALYGGQTPYRVRIIRWHTLHGSGDHADPPDVAEDRAVTCYHVWFEDVLRKGTFTVGGGEYLTLEEALDAVRGIVPHIEWTMTPQPEHKEAAMRVCAFLTFKGNARAAMNFYGDVFRSKPECMTYAEMPPDPAFPVTEDMQSLILHGELFVCKEQSIMVADDLRPGEGVVGNAISLVLVMDDEAEQRRIFAALAEGGTVLMPLAQTFWSVLFGSLTDRFGVTWHLNMCREPLGTTAK